MRVWAREKAVRGGIRGGEVVRQSVCSVVPAFSSIVTY